MRVVVIHPYTKFVGVAIRKIWCTMFVSINGPGDFDLWPFDLETGAWVASKLGNLPSKFGHARPLVSSIIRHVIFAVFYSFILSLLRYCDSAFENLIRFNICCSTPNFVIFFNEIWWFNGFQNGGRPPSWILKICSFCHVAFVGMPFRFLTQNFTEIGKSVDDLWVMTTKAIF